MKLKFILGAVCAFIATSPVFGGVINFENVNAPIGTDLGDFYLGVTFGPGDQIIKPVSLFPPVSGTHAVAAEVGPNISFVFDDPEASFSFFYTAEFGFTGVAENASGQVVDSFGGANNLGSNAEVSVTDASADIKTVVLTDKGGLPDFMTIDNLSAPEISGIMRPGFTVPESGSTLILLALAGAALWFFRGLISIQRRAV